MRSEELGISSFLTHYSTFLIPNSTFKRSVAYMQNGYYRKVSAMVLTLMITASAAAAVSAAPTVSPDKATTSIVSSANNDDNENESDDIEKD